jgi:hypothetical protein
MSTDLTVILEHRPGELSLAYRRLSTARWARSSSSPATSKRSADASIWSPIFGDRTVRLPVSEDKRLVAITLLESILVDPEGETVADRLSVAWRF